MNRAIQTALIIGSIIPAAFLVTHPPAFAQERTATVDPMHFHHIHLNAVNPVAAAAYYPRPFSATAVKTTFNGYQAVKTGNVYLLFTKVDVPPPTAPQSAVWHFGWNTPDSRKSIEGFRAMGLEIARMWDSNDGNLVDMSSDMLPGTQEEILAMRAKGMTPTRRGGNGYLRSPDGALIEITAGPVERFYHMHMYHEHPLCAQQWYVTHLGATVPQGRGAGAAPAPTAGDCRQPYAAPTFPSHSKTGTVRAPLGRVEFGDIAVAIHPWPGGGLVSSRGQAVDHWGLRVSDLDGTVARLKRAGIKFLEEIRPWGDTRAAMIEGLDRSAIELVEAR
jgi:hypothetical protein